MDQAITIGLSWFYAGAQSKLELIVGLNIRSPRLGSSIEVVTAPGLGLLQNQGRLGGGWG